MKKLMIAAAVAMVGIAANAGSYNWKSAAEWVYLPGEVDLEGTGYMFDSNTVGYDTMVAALTTGGWESYFDAETGSYMVSDAVEYGTWNMSGSKSATPSTGVTGNGAGPEGADTAASAYLVVIDSEGKNFWVTDEMTKPITEDIQGGAQIEFNIGEVQASWTTLATSAAPEPTSGLLLLLGVAGLALRRRRA